MSTEFEEGRIKMSDKLNLDIYNIILKLADRANENIEFYNKKLKEIDPITNPLSACDEDKNILEGKIESTENLLGYLQYLLLNTPETHFLYRKIFEETEEKKTDHICICNRENAINTIGVLNGLSKALCALMNCVAESNKSGAVENNKGVAVDIKEEPLNNDLINNIISSIDQKVQDTNDFRCIYDTEFHRGKFIAFQEAVEIIKEKFKKSGIIK